MASNLPNFYRGGKCRFSIKYFTFFLIPILPSSKDLYCRGGLG
jgi:hypothetical protein